SRADRRGGAAVGAPPPSMMRRVILACCPDRVSARAASSQARPVTTGRVATKDDDKARAPVMRVAPTRWGRAWADSWLACRTRCRIWIRAVPAWLRAPTVPSPSGAWRCDTPRLNPHKPRSLRTMNDNGGHAYGEIVSMRHVMITKLDVRGAVR